MSGNLLKRGDNMHHNKIDIDEDMIKEAEEYSIFLKKI